MHRMLLCAAVVSGMFEYSGTPVLADKLPASNASKELGMRYISEFEKANGKGSANQFGAHAFDVVIVLQKAVPIALKKGKPGTAEFRAALKDAFETMGRTPVSQGVLNWTASDHFGYTPETGVLLKVAKGDWEVVPN
jgi:branched-chain amino acid transport system substrate-binding protein